MLTSLQKLATYAPFKAWLLVVEDWVSSHAHTMPNNLGLATIRAMAHLTMSPDVYSWLEISGALGMTQVDGDRRMNRSDTTWG